MQKINLLHLREKGKNMNCDSETRIILKKDGNQWCATYSDFINLQESEAGFGDTQIEAIQELMKNKEK